MIERLRRYWLELVAHHHREMALDHERLRGRALRKLEAIERRRRDRETQREIGDILARRSPPPAPPRLVTPYAGHEFGVKPPQLRPFHSIKGTDTQ